MLIPEQPFDVEKLCDHVVARFETKYAPIIVVSEGAVPIDEFVARIKAEASFDY